MVSNQPSNPVWPRMLWPGKFCSGQYLASGRLNRDALRATSVKHLEIASTSEPTIYMLALVCALLGLACQKTDSQASFAQVTWQAYTLETLAVLLSNIRRVSLEPFSC